MFLSKSKCWYSNNCLHFLKCAVPLIFVFDLSFVSVYEQKVQGTNECKISNLVFRVVLYKSLNSVYSL